MKHREVYFLPGALAVLGLAFLYAGTAWAIQAKRGPQQQVQTTQNSQGFQILVKSYTLRFIKPEEILKAGRFYYVDATAYGNTIMVQIYPKQVPAFEKLLAALDVAPKTVLFRVYPIIATRGGETKKPATAVDPELKGVLDEMNTLWKFESYEMEGPSFIPVKEATGPNSFKLLSSRQMNLLVSEVKVTGEEAGKRTITIGQLRLSGEVNSLKLVFLDTHDIVLKENGYLVAGVSGYVGSDKALILVLIGEIK